MEQKRRKGRKKQEKLVLFPEVYTNAVKMTDAQFGVLMRSVFEYRFEGRAYEGDDLAVDVSFRTVAGQIDRYAEICETNSSNAKGEEDSVTETNEIQGNTAERSQNRQNTPPNPIPNPYPFPNSSKDKTAEKPPTPVRKEFSRYGWVKLTQEEYDRLVADWGEAEARRCIAYVDESAQSTKNKNKWRDWNLVVRRCHRDGWGKNTPPQGGRGSQMPDYGGADNWSL